MGWIEVDALRSATEFQEELFDQERALHERELDLERTRTEITQGQLELEVERRQFYQEQLEQLTRSGRSVGCVLKKVFTIGIARCG